MLSSIKSTGLDWTEYMKFGLDIWNVTRFRKTRFLQNIDLLNVEQNKI